MATGQLIDEDPEQALAHALAARRLASRISAVREAVGLAAYHAGEWQTAIAELRTYHRMSGLQSHLAVIADCERALGRPERAIDLFRGADQEKLDRAVAIELLIVAAGARGDLGQRDAAVAMLQVRELTTDTAEPWTARLRYAYADALLAVGRRAEAREWFSRAAEVDADAETDAAERLLELDGVLIEGDEEDEAAEELVAGPGAPGAVEAQPDTDVSGAAVAFAERAGDDDADDVDVDDADDDDADDDDADDDEDGATEDVTVAVAVEGEPGDAVNAGDSVDSAVEDSAVVAVVEGDVTGEAADEERDADAGVPPTVTPVDGADRSEQGGSPESETQRR
ncbi:Replicase polyprotein 1ab [Micromonospora fiedleri]|uniref:Replicase polyprotein 1ab n=1 Tax=Micromonospora fiedleri TaxID=1157498 RepID=A0ABS1UVN0_9ACTN|nr:Replicase polyprotein 1ab [Micromonospora fiedleri]